MHPPARSRAVVATLALLGLVAACLGVLSTSASAAAPTLSYSGDTVAGTIVLKKGDPQYQRTITNPASHIEATIADGHFNANATFAPFYTPNQAGPFGLVVYIKSEIVQATPFTGTVSSNGAVDGTGTTTLHLTVYRTTTGTIGQNDGQNPATDQVIASGQYCKADLALHITGSVDFSTNQMHIQQDPFTIPPFPLDTRVNGQPASAQGCAAAGPSINTQLAGPENSIDLTYGGTAHYVADLSSGTIVLKKGDPRYQRTITNPTSHIDATITSSGFTATSTFDSMYTPNQAGPFGLVVYIKSDIVQVSPFTGTISPTGAADASGSTELRLTVYRTTTGTVGQSNGQNPATDQVIASGQYCKVTLQLHLTGQFDLSTSTLHIAQDPFTVPTFPADTRVNGQPASAQGCAAATPSINTQLAGPDNSIDLTYGGTAVANRPPVANAGPDQAVTAGGPVTLDGSGSSDPDGDALTYRWTQTSGTPVTLSDATAAKPTFTAPTTAGPLTFGLTVDDGHGHTATDSTTVTVSAATTTATIGGTVTDASTSAPVGGADVRLWAVGASGPTATTTTDGSGHYAFGTVPPGSYQVQFAKSATYLTAWHTDAASRGGATTVTVAGGDTLTIDQALTPARPITGTVTDKATGHPVAGSRVYAFHANGGNSGITTTTDAQGHYTLALVPLGDWQVLVATSGYLDQWSGGSPDQAHASVVSVVAGGNPVVDFALVADPPGSASVSGTLDDSTTGQPVKGANVRLWKAFTNTYASVTTDADGHYALSGVAAGTYQLQFAKSGSYQTRWYSGATTRAGAGNVTLGSGSDVIIDSTLPPL